MELYSSDITSLDWFTTLQPIFVHSVSRAHYGGVAIDNIGIPAQYEIGSPFSGPCVNLRVLPPKIPRKFNKHERPLLDNFGTNTQLQWLFQSVKMTT